ncbi:MULTISPECIES: hypothetical protein [Pseudomonas]|uniref:hypothetical protein n=1 Tax=Pseudomonas TaxID=286 RepID=UPI000AE8D8C1|nr:MULTISPECIES: hypothetical protein [Pseudomonas]MDN6861944.1 hypothetical protein [Pseudomonas rhodesiae]UHG99206.1 hypothetical protein LQ249_06995 [Pseudomonas sp. 7-41]
MTPCIDAVRAAAGNLEDREIAEIFELLRGRAKELIAREGALGMEQATLRAADELGKQAQHAALIEKRNALLNLRRRGEIVSFVRGSFADRPDLGIESLLVGTNLARQGSRMSVAAEQKALGDAYIGGFIHDLERQDLVAILAKGDSDVDIADALWKIGTKQDTSKLNDQVVSIARTIQKYQEAARIDANRAGANIGNLPGYIARQSHDGEKIGSAGFDKWLEEIQPRLDARTFDDVANPTQFLRGVYDGLVSGDHLKAPGDKPANGFKGPANIAKKISQERVLHFKDGVAWHEYNTLFGTGNLREAVLRGLDMAGQNTGIMRRLGTNPEANLNMAMDILAEDVRKSGDPKALTNFNTARGNMIANRFAEVSGATRIPGNAWAARISANVRAWQSLSKLGGALLSSFADLPVAASEMRYQGKSFLGSLGEMTAGLAKGRGSLEQREILSSFGVYGDSMRGEIMRRFSADDSVGGKMSRGMSLFFKLNGLSWWTDANKASAGLMMAHNLAQNKGRAWGTMDAGLRRTLGLYDLDAGKWDLLRGMDTRMADGRDYMTTDGIPGIPDERISAYLAEQGRKVSASAIRETREGLERSLRAYVNDRVSYAVLEPDARTRSIMNQGTRPGTIMGDLNRFMTQFKSFPAAYMQKTLGRELYGRGYAPTPLGEGYRGSKDLIAALRNGNGERLAMAQLLLWTTAFGYLSMSAKDAVKGRQPRPADDPKTWIAAMTQGGGFGIMGDFMFGEVSRFGNKPLETLAGPTLGTAANALDLWAKIRSGDDAASSALRLAQNNTPFLNLFYTRIAMDHLFLWSVQEAMNPGSLRRTEQRIQQENGQKFLVKPSQSYLDPLGITR